MKKFFFLFLLASLEQYVIAQPYVRPATADTSLKKHLDSLKREMNNYERTPTEKSAAEIDSGYVLTFIEFWSVFPEECYVIAGDSSDSLQAIRSGFYPGGGPPVVFAYGEKFITALYPLHTNIERSYIFYYVKR